MKLKYNLWSFVMLGQMVRIVTTVLSSFEMWYGN